MLGLADRDATLAGCTAGRGGSVAEVAVCRWVPALGAAWGGGGGGANLAACCGCFTGFPLGSSTRASGEGRAIGDAGGGPAGS